MRTRRSQSSSDPVSSPFDKAKAKSEIHAPVLLHETVESLSIASGDIVVDATLGGAGHAKGLAEKLGKKGIFIGFDLDPQAIARAKHALVDAKPKVHLVQANFRHLEEELAKLGVTNVTRILFDLGWSAYQLDSGRGFSFLRGEPLLMTYSDTVKPDTLTAGKIVSERGEGSIADVLWGWGEERYSRRIAKAIVERRLRIPFTTSVELADVIKAAVPVRYRYGRIHPATKTFQALRITVNDELGSLTEGLNGAWKLLAKGGRIAVITFHSIEDRLVKQAFVEWEKRGEGMRIYKKPLTPTPEELDKNPRARSAKLRVIQKL